MREWQVDVEPELFQCSEGITVSGVGDSVLYNGGHGSEQWGGNLLRQRGDNMSNVKPVSGG